MKQCILAILCLCLTGCGVFEVRVQISPKMTPTTGPVALATASLEPTPSPMPVPAHGDAGDNGNDGGITAISAGESHACALTVAGAVKCWGLNNWGQLGNGTTNLSLIPVGVSGLGSGITAVSAGGWYTCALTAAGAVKCWGLNNYGQLGNDTKTSNTMPVDVIGLDRGVKAVSAGRNHTCVLTEGNGVKCWGWNESGQLGNGTTTDSLIPVDVVGLGDSVRAITVGDAHTCVLTEAGGVKCWGSNYTSQLGNGAATNKSRPTDVYGLDSGITAISAGLLHTCVLTNAGAVKCWGDNIYGELGNGTTKNSDTPADVIGLGSGITAISAGEFHTCALTAGGAVKCWGYNANGELGDGTKTDRKTPVEVAGLSRDVTAIAAGAQSCALIAEADVRCWGLNSNIETNVFVIGVASPAQGAPTEVVVVEPTPTTNALQPGQSIQLAAVQMSDTSRGWGVESSGHIVKTVDGGWTWKDMTPFQGSFERHSLFALNDQAVWVAPARLNVSNVVWRTQDGGTTWEASQAIPLGDGEYTPLGLQFPDARHGWLLLLAENGVQGSHVLLFRSSDGGVNWRPINKLNESVRQSYLPDTNTTMTFFDGQTGWLGGWWGQDAPNQWLILKTTDGGANWTTEELSLPKLNALTCDGHPIAHTPSGSMAVEMSCTHAKDARYFYHHIYYLSTRIVPTWRSWKISGDFISADFLNASQGWMMVTSGTASLNDILYTKDGGKNWTQINQVAWKQAQFDFVNVKDGWALVSNGFETALVRTENGGKVWIQVRPVAAAP